VKSKDRWYEERVAIAKKAFESSCVIFLPKTQQWYGPRSYIESGEAVEYMDPYGSSERKPKVVLHYVQTALDTQAKQVASEQQKMAILLKVVSETFSFEPKKKS